MYVRVCTEVGTLFERESYVTNVLTTWYLYMRSDSEALSWPFPSQFTPSSDRWCFSCLDRIISTTPAHIFRGFLHSLTDDISRRVKPGSHEPPCCGHERVCSNGICTHTREITRDTRYDQFPCFHVYMDTEPARAAGFLC